MLPTGSTSERFPDNTIEGHAEGTHDREHTDTRECGERSILGVLGPIIPVLYGVQGLKCSLPSCHFISPIHSLGIVVLTVPPPTARLLGDEILTHTDARKMPLTRVTNAASVAGHVSRLPAGWIAGLLI